MIIWVLRVAISTHCQYCVSLGNFIERIFAFITTITTVVQIFFVIDAMMISTTVIVYVLITVIIFIIVIIVSSIICVGMVFGTWYLRTWVLGIKGNLPKGDPWKGPGTLGQPY